MTGHDVTSALLLAALAAVLAALVTHVLAPLIGRLAMAARVVDYPGGRRKHHGAVPRLGGLAVVCGLGFGAGSIALIRWREVLGFIGLRPLGTLVLGTALVFLVGLVDDLIGMSSLKKLVVEVAAAAVVVAGGWHFTKIALPGIGNVELGLLGSVVAVVWIVGATNAVNLIDGLDGLAAGVVAIIAASMLVYAVIQGNLFTVLLMAATLGACLGFLRHNWEPAAIFMGDAGSLTLGFLLSTTSILSNLKSTAAVAILVPLLALGVPLIDTLFVMLVRFLERPKKRWVERFLRVFTADRSHLHHLVQNVSRHHAGAVRLIYGLVLFSCLAALSVALTKSIVLGVALVAVEAAAVLVVRRLGWARQIRAASSDRLGGGDDTGAA